MLKKLMAVMAMVGLLSAQTAMADVTGPRTLTPLVTITTSLSTFNPSVGESIRATVSVSQESTVVVKVINSQTGTTIAIPMPAQVVKVGETKAVTYNGLSNNSPIANGAYTIQAVARNIAGTSSGDDEEYFTITSGTPATTLTLNSFSLSTTSFNPTTSSDLNFNYSLSKTPTEVSAVITKADGTAVATVTNTAPTSATGTLSWNGKATNSTTLVAAGDYKVTFTAKAGTETVTSTAQSFSVVYSIVVINSTILKGVTVDQNPWDPSDDELQIEWEFSEDVKDFSLIATDNSGHETELWDDEDMDEDDYEFNWNGLDEDDEMIEDGDLTLTFKADNDTVVYGMKVDYSEVKIYDDLFVTKDSFDNSIEEFSYVVFRVDQDADVTVEVLDGGKDIVTLMDEEEVSKNKWVAVKWDGVDEDGDEVDEGDYEFKITATNTSNEDVETTAKIGVNVEEDELDSKTNATNDFITPVVVDKNSTSSDTATIEYTIDDNAEVTIEIFEGSKSSNPEIVLAKNVSKKAGTYEVTWNGRDEDGKRLEKNTKYSYRVTAKTEGSTSKTDKERGYFVVGDLSSGSEVTPPDGPDPVDPEDCGFYDVSTSSEYCEAAAWAQEANIFDGNPDGTFRPYNFINRAEALKVTLKAFDLPILPNDYTNLGFSDVTVGSWYMPYLRTGKFYGMVAGYAGTTFVKPGETINRVELLRYVLEAAETVGGYDVPVCHSQYYTDTDSSAWYSDYVCLAHDYDLYNTYSGYFYPGNNVMRGEVALLLYRLNNAGLLK